MIQPAKYFSLLLTVLLAGCASHRNQGTSKASIDNVVAKVSFIKDSLIAKGVDSIFIIRKNCRECEARVPKMDPRAKKSKQYFSPPFPRPAYIFWVSDGKYFIKKIDLSGEYPTIRREISQQLPLYEYFFQNRESILNEEPVYQIIDTILAPGHYAPPDTFIERTFIHYHNSDDNRSDPFPAYTTEIFFYGPGVSFNTVINDDLYNPVVTTPHLAYSLRRNSSSGRVLVGNDLKHYTMNRSMKIFTWIKLAESELFDIEMRKLWGPAK